MASPKYRYEVDQENTSLGQIEQGLALLGFRVIEAHWIDGNLDGTIRQRGEGFRVVFEPLPPSGKVQHRARVHGAEINQIQGRIEEAPHA